MCLASPGRPTYFESAPGKGLTRLLRALELRGELVHTDEAHRIGMIRIRIGVVRHSTAAHALCEPQFPGERPLVLRRRRHATREEVQACPGG